MEILETKHYIIKYGVIHNIWDVINNHYLQVLQVSIIYIYFYDLQVFDNLMTIINRLQIILIAGKCHATLLFTIYKYFSTLVYTICRCINIVIKIKKILF